LDMTDEQRNRIALIIQSTMHHVVVDVLLEEMHDDYKHIFLGHIANDDHEKVWDLLNQEVEKPEEKIIEAIRQLKDELILDIQEAAESSDEE